MVLGRLAITNLPLNCSVSAYQPLKELLHTSCLVYTLTRPSSGPSKSTISSNATTRLYFLNKFIELHGLLNSHLLHFYLTVLRSVLCTIVALCTKGSSV